MSDFREAVYSQARKDAFKHRDPHEAYAYWYKAHLEEAFTALINEVHRLNPDAELRYVGSDMGGPLWEVREPLTQTLGMGSV